MRLRRKIGLAVAAFLGVLLLAIGLVPYVVDGVPNWEFTPGAGARQKPGEAAAGFHMAVGRLSMVHGVVNFTDPVSKRRLLAEDVTASATVGSFDGPFTLDGSATVNGVPLT